jgi:predicted SprT family Zn-dependent metalloprotease
MKYLNKIYDEINADIFGGVLDRPLIVCMNDGAHYGWYYGWDSAILNINPVYCADYALTFGTMAHEIIHQFQFFENKRLTHGKFFYKMALEIETFYQLPKGSI